MLLDLRTEPVPESLTVDVCLIGAGAAGITVARALAGSGLSVCLLESGGFDFEQDTQALYQVENAGLVRRPEQGARLRYFGGSTNHWTGRCAPLDPIDFEHRAWVPHSGWPLSRTDLDPYYELAQEVCELGPYVYDERVRAWFDVPEPGLDPETLALQVWQMSPPTRFGLRYREDLVRSESTQVVLHANAVRLQADPTGRRVEHVEVRSLDGHTARVVARRFVLCCGGLENARLLLLSDDVVPTGLGNRHDLVGRFYMEHLRTRDSLVLHRDPSAIKRIFNHYEADRAHYLLGFRLPESLQRGEELLSAGALTRSRGGEDSATATALDIGHSVRRGEVPDALGTALWRVLSDLDEVVINTRRHFLRPGSPPLVADTTVLSIDTEQTPNPDSRLTLSDERDALGLRLARVDWRLTEGDRHTLERTTLLLATELARLYDARVRIPEWVGADDADWAAAFRDVGHQMGTTRMADDPTRGVVDRDCRVHGIDNLFIAGSSVFPTSGHANPTLTLVALALRLADHLRTEAR